MAHTYIDAVAFEYFNTCFINFFNIELFDFPCSFGQIKFNKTTTKSFFLKKKIIIIIIKIK